MRPTPIEQYVTGVARARASMSVPTAISGGPAIMSRTRLISTDRPFSVLASRLSSVIGGFGKRSHATGSETLVGSITPTACQPRKLQPQNSVRHRRLGDSPVARSEEGRRTAVGTVDVVRIPQYAYRAVKSEIVTVDQMTDWLGMPPDRAEVPGSRSADPPRPVCNICELRSDDAGLTVDAHVQQLIERAAPIADRLRGLAEDVRCGVVLQIARFFNDDNGEEERVDRVDVPVGGFERLGGQHQLLGWHLDKSALAFLASSGCELDVDEYG